MTLVRLLNRLSFLVLLHSDLGQFFLDSDGQSADLYLDRRQERKTPIMKNDRMNQADIVGRIYLINYLK